MKDSTATAVAQGPERAPQLNFGSPGRPAGPRRIDLTSGDVNCIVVTGTWGCLQGYGFPTSGALPTHGATLAGPDGKDWRIDWEGDTGMFQSARRARTPEEREDFIDERNSLVVSSFFSSDRQRLAWTISQALLDMVDFPMDPRRARRNQRKIMRRLVVLGSVLQQLTGDRTAKMRTLRTYLHEIGIEAPQIDLMARYH